MNEKCYGCIIVWYVFGCEMSPLTRTLSPLEDSLVILKNSNDDDLKHDLGLVFFFLPFSNVQEVISPRNIQVF